MDAMQIEFSKGKENMLKGRDGSIDFLRSIGLLCVILAHADVPKAIARWRCFDVVLLVFVSGLSFLASRGNEQNYFVYLKKRVYRLVLPTWKFLCIFFILFGTLHILNPIFPKFSIKEYLYSFLFVSGIGYVWIIMVYLIVSAALPILKKILDTFEIKNYLLILAILYISYEVLIRMALYISTGTCKNGGVIPAALHITYLGYIFVCGIGIVMKQMNKKQRILLIIILTVVFIIFSLINNFASVQIEKYPPTAYYLSYGLLISVLLYLLTQTDIKLIKALECSSIVRWISQNSLWIYLWHIIPVKILVDYEVLHMKNWVLCYGIILTFAFVVTALCNFILSYWRIVFQKIKLSMKR